MQVKIDRMDHFGRGIAYIHDKIVFVDNALSDEVVSIKIYKENQKKIEARGVKVITESKEREKPKCPYYDFCGGCNIMHMKYSTQLTFKENKVKDIVKKYAGISPDKVRCILPSPQFYYRNKIILHVQDKKIGLYKNKSHEIIEIDKCLLVNERINQIIKILKKFIKETNHCIEEIIIRGSNDFLLYIKGKVEQEKIADYFKNINVVVNDKAVLYNGFIMDTLFDKDFIVSPNSFYQVNGFQTEKLYDLVVSYFKDEKCKKVLDLYCGTGTIGMIMSDYVEEVVGIEINSSSYLDALKNKELNQIGNIHFINGKVEDFIDSFDNIDAIVVDPPRNGLDKHVIGVLKTLSSKKIIYVSCDVMTLARDLKLLNDKYEVLEITPVDMFPNTYHVECVCVLKLR